MGILLEALPGFTWWGGFGVTIIITVIAYYFKRDANAQEKRIDKVEEEVKKVEDSLHATNERLHSVKETVLKEIHGISLSIERFRNDNART